jgi:hypothetical protein
MIRYAERGDERALARLAGRDSRPVPAGALLVAASDGEIRAALSLDGRGAIADPFHPTAELVRLLEVRRTQLGAQRAERPRPARHHRRARFVPAFVGRLARR